MLNNNNNNSSNNNNNPWLATFLEEETFNIKLGAGESLALVGNHLEMMSP